MCKGIRDVMIENREEEETKNKTNKLGARTLVARSGGSKNVTYREQTT